MSEHLLIFWQRKLEDAYRENYELKTENARLKAEVERLQSIHSIDSIGIEQLKAEVERLTEVIKAQSKGLDEKFGRDVAAKEGQQS